MLTLPDDRREVVFGAVTACFARNGLKATSMQMLADAAGMSRPALYQYFANKMDLFVAAAAWQLERRATMIEAIESEQADLRLRLSRMLHAVLHLYTPVEGDAPFHPDLIDEVLLRANAPWTSFQDRTIAAMTRALSAHGMPEATARTAAAVLLISVKGIGIETNSGAAFPLSVEALVDFVLRPER